MPIVQSRRVRVALWVALAVLVLPASLSVLDLARGDGRGLARLIALAIVAISLTVALWRQRALEARVREKDALDQALRASEAKFAGILSIAADAIISVGEDQRIVHFNHGAEQIFGWPAAEAIGRELATLIPARYRGGHPGHMRSFAQSPIAARRMGERGEIFGLRRDGTEFPAEASISKLATPTGLLFTVVLRDTTERQRAQANERFLADASAKLGRSLDVRTTLHTAAELPVPYLADACLLDLVPEGDGPVERFASAHGSEAFTEAVRRLATVPPLADSPWPSMDVVRRRVPLVVAAPDAEWFEANDERDTLATWSAVRPTRLAILPLVSGDRAIGAITLIGAGPLPGGDEPGDVPALAQKYAAVAATAIDNARLYELAQRATQARDEVLGVVSHDLRNPISAISMCARALEANDQGDAEADAGKRRELLITIQEASSWINRLIQDLVDVSSIERGRLSLNLAPREPAAIVEAARHLFQVEAAEHDIGLEATVSPDVPTLLADDERLVQVLANLIRNAIKFTPAAGRVTISARPGQGGVVFSVQDTGRGIPQENLARIFDRYWQSASGARAKGSGLGLSIAKGIVEAHGGRIAVLSEAGAGTTVEFVVPRFMEPS